jgi:hypothetical protein
MKSLKGRAPRIAGLLALVLGAVALLAISGVAAAKDHGNDDNGHHGNHGRHHDHGRHHHRVLEMREAGTISSFDATTGKLTIALQDGGTFAGLVTDGTEIKCEGVDDRRGRRDHGSGDNSGSGSGDDNGGHSLPGDDHGGRGTEPGDDNGGRGTEPGDDNGGQNEPGDDNGGEVAGARSCTTASLVPGAVVEEAELRLEGGNATFKEIELGHDS